MVSSFVTELKDDKHRIVIDKEIWKLEGLEVGDYIKVTIEKIQKTKK